MKKDNFGVRDGNQGRQRCCQLCDVGISTDTGKGGYFDGHNEQKSEQAIFDYPVPDTTTSTALSQQIA